VELFVSLELFESFEPLLLELESESVFVAVELELDERTDEELRESVLYQPEPLKTTGAAAGIRRAGFPQRSHGCSDAEPKGRRFS
jgi:hypothetical protein